MTVEQYTGAHGVEIAARKIENGAACGHMYDGRLPARCTDKGYGPAKSFKLQICKSFIFFVGG
jgi:hypothetical protein